MSMVNSGSPVIMRWSIGLEALPGAATRDSNPIATVSRSADAADRKGGGHAGDA